MANLKLVESEMETDKQKALAAALTQIDRAFGKGSVMRLGEQKVVEIEAISTGSLGLDIALGIGGLPRGRIVEIYGPESSGKTTLALHCIAEAQKNGGVCAFVDAEHALDPVYARKLGVDLDDLLVSQPDTGEQALEITDTLVRSGAVDVLVIDSVAALTPRAEIEGEMGDQLPGLQARLMSQALRKLTGSISKSKTLVIFINQIRMKIGVMYGNPETTTGGNALKFYASVRLDIRRTGQIKERDEVVGSETRVKVVKNKVAPPFKQVSFDIIYGEGISKTGELIELGVKAGVIDKSGAWYAYGGQKIGQGKETARRFLKDHKDIAHAVEDAVRQKSGVVADAMYSPPEGDEEKDAAESGEFRWPVRAFEPFRPHALASTSGPAGELIAFRLIGKNEARRMRPHISLLTLGVEDVARARGFYERLGFVASSASQGDVVFFQAGALVLALYPRVALAEDAAVSGDGEGFRGIALAHNVRERGEVAAVLAEAEAAGGRILKPAQDVFWGGHSGYFADLDGHVWEVAWNPQLIPDADGAVRLP
jgi:recombination protein RecA